MKRATLLRFAAYWFGAGLLGYVVIVLPLVVLLDLSGASAFFVGMLAGGMTPVVGFGSDRVQNWIGL